MSFLQTGLLGFLSKHMLPASFADNLSQVGNYRPVTTFGGVVCSWKCGQSVTRVGLQCRTFFSTAIRETWCLPLHYPFQPIVATGILSQTFDLLAASKYCQNVDGPHTTQGVQKKVLPNFGGNIHHCYVSICRLPQMCWWRWWNYLVYWSYNYVIWMFCE